MKIERKSPIMAVTLKDLKPGDCGEYPGEGLVFIKVKSSPSNQIVWLDTGELEIKKVDDVVIPLSAKVVVE